VDAVEPEGFNKDDQDAISVFARLIRLTRAVERRVIAPAA